jgi:prepilin-type N-terminal cleavage/methylation domain-containing protein/prepilin-type processing-associated H-X9-DG protein
MKRTAFTLIELLVVIAALAILIGVLAPALRAAGQQAKTVVCGSNLKQLSLALTVYEQATETFPYGFNDSLPIILTIPPGDYPGNHVYDSVGWWWYHYLTDTLGETFEKGTVFWCPAKNITGYSSKANILCGNYGVNRAICKDAESFGNNEFFGEPLGLEQIYRPSQTLLVIDSGYSLISWWGVTNATAPDKPFENTNREGCFYVPGAQINNGRTMFPGFESDALEGRHPNHTVNVVFTDGHSARLSADDLFVEEKDGLYINRSPLWLPE